MSYRTNPDFTPEPWTIGTAVRVEAGQRANPTTYPYHAVYVDNWERAVACVNALAGIEDPEAFVREVLELFEECDSGGFKRSDLRPLRGMLVNLREPIPTPNNQGD